MKTETDCRGIIWNKNSKYRKEFYDMVSEAISEGYSFELHR